MAKYRNTYLKDFVVDRVLEAYRSVRGVSPTVEVDVRPNDRPELGDFSTNVAMVEANRQGLNPRSLAEELAQAMASFPSETDFAGCKAAGPGFINLFLATQRIQSALRSILADGTEYGRQTAGSGRKIQVEFVSSNPTGPLTVGHGRQAVLGDVLATLYEWLGYDVHREYYFNDEGRQIDLLAESLWARYRALLGDAHEIPEDGYRGEYLIDLARHLRGEMPDGFPAFDEEARGLFGSEAVARMTALIKEDLAKLDVRFDEWFSEATLHSSGEVSEALAALREHGGILEKDGAIWLKAEEHGGAKDSVLVRSDGRPTYLMVDIAYHINKRNRGFDRVIDVQGADHHTEQTCVKAALRILGYPEEFLDYEVHQFVSLKQKGEIQRMSTRAGRFVTLRDLIDELDKDIVRYFMISRKPEAHLDFDLDLARAESLDNPATYIQYAHTRIASIFRKANAPEADWADVDLSPLVEQEEIELIKTLDRFPEVVRIAAQDFAPHLLAEYALDLSRSFHAYYDKHRVLTDDEGLSRARLALLSALRTVLRNSLAILGMDTPLEM
jgi:arginyl-tRNA synthetase